MWSSKPTVWDGDMKSAGFGYTLTGTWHSKPTAWDGDSRRTLSLQGPTPSSKPTVWDGDPPHLPSILHKD